MVWHNTGIVQRHMVWHCILSTRAPWKKFTEILLTPRKSPSLHPTSSLNLRGRNITNDLICYTYLLSVIRDLQSSMAWHDGMWQSQAWRSKAWYDTAWQGKVRQSMACQSTANNAWGVCSFSVVLVSNGIPIANAYQEKRLKFANNRYCYSWSFLAVYGQKRLRLKQRL